MPFLRRLLSRNNGGTATSDDSSRPPHDEPPSYESNNGAHVAPDYIDEVDDLPPPAFDFPTSYAVGHHPNRESTGTLFIIRSDVQAHVRLLAAFERLRQKVEAGCAGIGADLDPKSRWSLFVNVAIHRLEMFLRVMSMMSDEGHTEQVLPPLDVAMALHAYMLQPLRYAEDKLRDAPPLCGVKRTLLSDVAFAINGSTFELPVNPAMQSVWTDLTNTPYDPLEYFATTETRMTPEIHGFPSIDVPWITPDKTGYAQEGFKAKSPDGLIYTHATLGVAKLASDVFRCRDDPLATLAGTVVSPWLLPEQPAGAPGARWVATRMARSLEIRRSDSPQDLANAYKWDRDTIEKSFLSALGMYKQGGINGILNCYIRGEPFSVDLVPLMLREADFIRDLAKLGWFTPGKLDEDTATLDRIIARYHGFMDVVAANPPLTCIPTVDIELAWQTHLLKPTYLSDIHSEVGRLVDHDPAIEESALARLFDETSDAWMARYRVPYSLCACTASRTGGQTKLAISALRSHIRGSASTVDAPTRAEYSARGYPDNSATHPSELVCVTFVNKSDALRERQKRHKVAQARKKEAESGAVPPCVLAGVAGGAYLKPSLQSVCYGTSGYALNEEDGFVICARLADPATVLGGEGYGPHAVPGRAMSVAAFRAQAGVGLGTGWEGMALGAMSVGAGGFSM